MTPIQRPTNPLTLVLVLSGLFFVVFLVISAAVFFSKSSGSAKSTASPGLFGAGGSVGVVELNGVIMDSKKLLRRLERFEEDAEIKGVVLRINSPGGSVAPSQEIYEAVKKYKKPLVVSMASVAASGGYYIACGAKKVYANAGTITGSIGVIMEFMNLEKLYEWAKVKRFSIKTGRFKDAGAEYREMQPEERALLQGMVDDVLTQFKKAVSEGRKLSMEKVSAVADGRIFSGAQAKAAGLVDELGTLQDAIDDVARQAKIKGKANVVYPERNKHKLWQTLLQDAGGEDEGAEQSSLGGFAALLKSLGIGSAPLRAIEQDLSVPAPGIYWLWPGAR